MRSVAFTQQSEDETYRVVVRQKDTTDLLLVSTDKGLLLPSVEVARWQRVAESLTAAMKKEWGYEVLCLFAPNVTSPPAHSNGIHYQVMECYGRAEKYDTRTQWVPVSSLSEPLFADSADYMAVQQCLAEWGSYAHGPAPGPFARPGWFGEVRSWVEEVIGPLGIQLKSNFSQFNASPSFSLMRLETDGPAIWFKAVGAPNIREFPITVALARLLPKYVPPILATRPEWNAWLTLEIKGSNLEETQETEAWKAAATALADLQIDSMGNESQLLSAGARDLRASTLSSILQPFLEVMAQLMKEQTKVPPVVLTKQELVALGEHIHDALSKLAQLGIRNTLGHLDLNPGNVIVSPSGCKFLDWAEAYVGHPFFSFEYLREHFRRSIGANAALESQLVTAYAEPWRARLPDDAVNDALALAPMLAVFAHAVGNEVWSDPEKLQQPATAGYLRSLTRRLKRESDRLVAGRSPMHSLIEPPPQSRKDNVTEILHGIPITDPYRWLEDQESPQTRGWIEAQTRYARSYLDGIPGRDRIRGRIRELLDVETYDSVQKSGNRYIFRKRPPGQEQPSIFLREGPDGRDELLLDPAERGAGKYTAVKPLRVSPDGRLLLYEIKEGGERTGTFEILDIEQRRTLPDVLPRGYLRGFVFAPDCRSFYYVHESAEGAGRCHRAAYRHVLGTDFSDDQQIFFAGESPNIRLHILPGKEQLGFLVYRLLDKTYTDFYLWRFDSKDAPKLFIENAEYKLAPLLLDGGRILAITDRDAPNFRIVEICQADRGEPQFTDLIPNDNARIQSWAVTRNEIFVSYIRGTQTEVGIFDLAGRKLSQLSIEKDETVRLIHGSPDGDELLLERESFTKPVQICSCSSTDREPKLWAERPVPFASQDYDHEQVWFIAKEGTRIPMFLVGRRDVLKSGSLPTIMTSYGGYGVAMTPQFSVFVAFLMERGCLFALPNIRGGSEFGSEWHDAAKRRKRQVAFDDFLSAAEWLIETGRADPRKLAIFGGSNSGLLVGAAMTQRPNLFRAVICMVPMLDMLRYHLFDNAHLWKDEYGTSEDTEDFSVLASYSPYYNVCDGTRYPATMFVSGDRDQNCNPLHARKMTARLQAASSSEDPIILDYCPFRGHSPVLPLSERIEGLTDRMAFLCEQLNLSR